MNTWIMAIIAAAAALAAFAAWETILKLAGGKVTLDPNSLLMKKWREALVSRNEEYRDPINLCQLFHYVWGARRIEQSLKGWRAKMGQAVDYFGYGEAESSANIFVRCAAKWIIPISVGLILGALALGILSAIFLAVMIAITPPADAAILSFLPRGLATNIANTDRGQFFGWYALILGALAVGAGLITGFIFLVTRPAFKARFLTVWLKLCPPVSVHHSTTTSNPDL